jgi:hypothetical protein
MRERLLLCLEEILLLALAAEQLSRDITVYYSE